MWMMDDPNPSSNIPRSSRRRQPTPRILLGACGCTDAAKFSLLCQFFVDGRYRSCFHTRLSIPFFQVSPIPRPTFNLEWTDVIAPLSANTFAKIAQGISDNSLTQIVRGWDPNKPLYVAPAIDPVTWNNPLTTQYRKRCDVLGINIIDPSPRGEMADPTEISYIVKISNEEIWD